MLPELTAGLVVISIALTPNLGCATRPSEHPHQPLARWLVRRLGLCPQLLYWLCRFGCQQQNDIQSSCPRVRPPSQCKAQLLLRCVYSSN
jgi:hypothetical protein